MHFTSTDLPEPEPPMMTTLSLLADVEIDTVEHDLPPEGLLEAADGDLGRRRHGQNSTLVSALSKSRMRIEAETTELVVAAPTPWAPPASGSRDSSP